MLNFFNFSLLDLDPYLHQLSSFHLLFISSREEGRQIYLEFPTPDTTSFCCNSQSWARVFKITSRLAPVHLFQTVSCLALSRIFQQQKFASLAFCIIAYRVSKITSRCFRVRDFRGCNFCACSPLSSLPAL